MLGAEDDSAPRRFVMPDPAVDDLEFQFFYLFINIALCKSVRVLMEV